MTGGGRSSVPSPPIASITLALSPPRGSGRAGRGSSGLTMCARSRLDHGRRCSARAGGAPGLPRSGASGRAPLARRSVGIRCPSSRPRRYSRSARNSPTSSWIPPSGSLPTRSPASVRIPPTSVLRIRPTCCPGRDVASVAGRVLPTLVRVETPFRRNVARGRRPGRPRSGNEAMTGTSTGWGADPRPPAERQRATLDGLAAKLPAGMGPGRRPDGGGARTLRRVCVALGTVIQQREAMKSSDEEANSAGFLLTLARRPMWVAGISADAIGFSARRSRSASAG